MEKLKNLNISVKEEKKFEKFCKKENGCKKGNNARQSMCREIPSQKKNLKDKKKHSLACIWLYNLAFERFICLSVCRFV